MISLTCPNKIAHYLIKGVGFLFIINQLAPTTVLKLSNVGSLRRLASANPMKFAVCLRPRQY
jgi:hypothetical protein